MPLHDVTFEDVGFTSRKRDFSAEPGENAIAAFNADAPEGVSLVSISASPDDSVHEGGKDESGEYKVFVSVVVRREYDAGVDPADSDHAGDETFLTKAADRFFPGLGMEGNWEYADSEPAEAPVPSP